MKNVVSLDDTPRTQTRKLLRTAANVPQEARKTSDFHHALVTDVREQYHSVHILHTHNRMQRVLVSRTLSGRIVKKYRMQKFARQTFGFSYKRQVGNADPSRSMRYEKMHIKEGKDCRNKGIDLIDDIAADVSCGEETASPTSDRCRR